jgi:hypothetical protein
VARFKPDAELDEAVVMSRIVPDIVRRECGGTVLPMLRLYHLGREFATVSFGGGKFHSSDAVPIAAAFCAALDAPWNQPGVDPQSLSWT